MYTLGTIFTIRFLLSRVRDL